jgi:TonB family protein
VVAVEGQPISTVHILRIVKSADGKTTVARSVGPEALAIAADLLPAEFPVAPPAPGPAAANLTNSLSAGSAYPIGPGITPPSVLSKVAPNYSEKARKAKLEGTVTLRGVIGTDGIGHDFQVTQSLGSGLDEEAIAAVSQWRFRPGVKDGKAVPVIVTIQVNFRLVKH